MLAGKYTVYTPNQRYSRIASAYGTEKDATDQSEDIRPARILGGASAADLEQVGFQGKGGREGWGGKGGGNGGPGRDRS